MKKLLLLFAMVVGCLGIAHAETYTANYTDIANPNSVPTSWTSNGVTWTMSYEWEKDAQGQPLTPYTGRDNNNGKGFQIGSSNVQCTEFKVSTDQIPGTVTSVTINSSTASKGSANISVNVGGTAFTCNGETTAAATKDATDYIFNGSASGNIEITINGTAKKAFYIKSITVEYIPDGPVELGALTVSCNDAAVVSPLTIDEGTSINFHADHATSFEVTVDDTAPVVLPAQNGSASWTPTVCANANVSVVAKRNDQTSNTLTFTLTVNKSAYAEASEAMFDFSKTGNVGTLTTPTIDMPQSSGVDIDGVVFTYGPVSIETAKGGNNGTKWWNDGTCRLYQKNKITVSVPAGYYIVSATFLGANKWGNLATGNVKGDWSTFKNISDDHTWTATEQPQTVVFDASGNRCDFEKLVVKYAQVASAEPELDGEPQIEVFHHKNDGFILVNYNFYVKNFDANQHNIVVLATVNGLEEAVVFEEVQANKAPARAASESTQFTASLKSNIHDGLKGTTPTVKVKATLNDNKELFNKDFTDIFDISGIEGVEAEANEGEAVYYNLQGQRVEANQPGLYIRKANGKVSKVVIR